MSIIRLSWLENKIVNPTSSNDFPSVIFVDPDPMSEQMRYHFHSICEEKIKQNVVIWSIFFIQQTDNKLNYLFFFCKKMHFKDFNFNLLFDKWMCNSKKLQKFPINFKFVLN